MAGPVTLALAFVVAASFAATCWVLGRLVLRRIACDPQSALAPALGLALSAQVAFALALVGALRPLVTVALAVAVHVAGWREWRAWRGPLLARWRESPALALGGCAFFAAVVVLASYPATAFDEVVYHLPMARAFAETGGLPVLPLLRFPVFPALGEILQAVSWQLGGELATHGIAAFAVLATGWLLLRWDDRPGAEAAGWLAAATWAGSPIVVYLAGSGYLEPLLALWSIAALFAVERWRREGQTAWCVLAACFAGCAAATKYLGLLTLAVVGLEVLCVAWRQRRRDLAWFCLVAALTAVPCYVRLLTTTGNPLFPFYTAVFGSTAWDADHLLGVAGSDRLATLPTRLWDVVARRERVGQMPPFSPVLPLMGALALWTAVVGPRAGRRAAIFALVFLLLAPVNAHYLVLALPALAIAGGIRVAQLSSPASRRLAAALAAALLLPGLLYAASWWWRFGPPPLSLPTRERYLTERLPLYGSLQALERAAGTDYTAWALAGETLKYHARGRLLGEVNGPHADARILTHTGQPGALAATLRGAGAGYLLVPEEWAGTLGAGRVDWERHFAQVYGDGRGRVYRTRG
jgi:hypothetical protein